MGARCAVAALNALYGSPAQGVMNPPRLRLWPGPHASGGLHRLGLGRGSTLDLPCFSGGGGFGLRPCLRRPGDSYDNSSRVTNRETRVYSVLTLAEDQQEERYERIHSKVEEGPEDP